MPWKSIIQISSTRFTCGHCGAYVASDQGWAFSSGGQHTRYIYISPHCEYPTFFDPSNNQTPGPLYGSKVANITSEEVEAIFEEARRCMSVTAFNVAVLCCRKLLMNISVSEGADKNKTFAYYVDYIVEKHLPKAKDWIDHIREKGNEATHEIEIMTETDAKRLIEFSEMLLRVIYEYPASVGGKTEKTEE